MQLHQTWPAGEAREVGCEEKVKDGFCTTCGWMRALLHFHHQRSGRTLLPHWLALLWMGISTLQGLQEMNFLATVCDNSSIVRKYHKRICQRFGFLTCCPEDLHLQRYFQELPSSCQRAERYLVSCVSRQVEMGGAHIPVRRGSSLSCMDTCSAQCGRPSAPPSVTSTKKATPTSLTLLRKAGPKPIPALSQGCHGWPATWADSQDKW